MLGQAGWHNGTCVMPRYWFWMQTLIFLFVVAGMVIALTKLA
jgi:hypothetical protein